MSTTVTTMSLGTSNLRSTSRQTRNNPVRNSRNARPALRQNSLVSNPVSLQGVPAASDPPGFYPGISHFTDAISALPRDYRRHTSLLKEVDAKAWALEENFQSLLVQCLRERQTNPVSSASHTVAGSSSSVVGDVPATSAAASVSGGIVADDISQLSRPVADPDVLKRRHLYGALRHNLLQMMVTMDEKNHVIHNANEDLNKHIRRLDVLWPHVSGEISEDARLGSLKHWALTDLNPTKKAVAAPAIRGRDAVATVAGTHDNDIAERSERRREAVLAKKQKAIQPADSDVEDRVAGRRTAGAGKNKRTLEAVADAAAGLSAMSTSTGKGKGKKPEKLILGPAAMERQASNSGIGAKPMSREPSQQENSKKRKASAATTTAARKRLNVTAQESPKLVSSPLAGAHGKDAYKRSPALSTVRPAVSRVRQNSNQILEPNRSRPASSAATKNANTAPPGTAEPSNSSTKGKTGLDSRSTANDTTTSRSDKSAAGGTQTHAETVARGTVGMERTSSRQSMLKREAHAKEEATVRATASPRLTLITPVDVKNDRTGKGRSSKTSTPLVSTFTEAEASESTDNADAVKNGADGEPTSSQLKSKRPSRPRIKDHGLHDSLSPKGLPSKRTHKKNGSYSLSQPSPRLRDRDEELNTNSVQTSNDRKATTRTNSRSTKSSNQENNKENPTPTTVKSFASNEAELTQEPEPLNEVKPRGAQPHTRVAAPPPPPTAKAETNTATGNGNSSTIVNKTGSGGGGGVANQDATDEEGEDEDDLEEQRYCYCNGVSYGEMVACDNEDCPREWFHLECVGLRSLPSRSAKWYCDECKRRIRGN